MNRQLKKVNQYLMISWMAIVVVLTFTYFGEFLRGHRDLPYMITFLSVTIIPAVVCLVYYLHNRESA